MCKKPRKIRSSDGNAFIFVPCNKCIECQKQYSLNWSYRIMLEAKQFQNDEIAFITLTYDNDHNDGLLHKRDIQLFIKRCRKNFGEKLRYFACGEYGAKGKRPHYHLLLFGHVFAKQLFYVKSGVNYFRSLELEKLWKNGFSLLTDYDDATAIYLCKYMQKSQEKYFRKMRIPRENYPFLLQSRKPPIGYNYLDNLTENDIKDDKIYINGHYIKYPRIFLDKLASRGVDVSFVKENRLKRCIVDDLEELLFYEKKYKFS